MVGNLSGYVTGTVPVVLSNLNHGQDPRANRTSSVQFSSVQRHRGEPGHTRQTHEPQVNQPQNQPHPPTHAPVSIPVPVKRDNLFFSHRPSASIARTVRDIREPPAPEGDHGPSCQGVGQLRVDPRRLPRRACISAWSLLSEPIHDADATRTPPASGPRASAVTQHVPRYVVVVCTGDVLRYVYPRGCP